MNIVKTGTFDLIAIVIEDELGNGITGLTASTPGLSAVISKGGSSWQSFPLSGAFSERTGGPPNCGVYSIQLDPTNTNVNGQNILCLTYGGVNYFVEFFVRQQSEADIYLRQGTPAGVSQSADVAAVKADTAALRMIGDENTRLSVLTRDGSNRPLTVRVYKWDSKANYDANGVTGRTEYLVTLTYHASGKVDTQAKGQV